MKETALQVKEPAWKMKETKKHGRRETARSETT
jgi:hypothetical protein